MAQSLLNFPSHSVCMIGVIGVEIDRKESRDRVLVEGEEMPREGTTSEVYEARTMDEMAPSSRDTAAGES